MSKKGDKEMELLSAFIDGELEEAEKNRVTSFLSNSPEGRKALERIKHTKALLMSTPAIHTPSDFLDKLEAQAEKTLAAHRSRQFFWRWSNPWAWGPSLAVAAAAFALVIGLRPTAEIPYESLLAAHQDAQCGVNLHQKLLAASHAPAPAASQTHDQI